MANEKWQQMGDRSIIKQVRPQGRDDPGIWRDFVQGDIPHLPGETRVEAEQLELLDEDGRVTDSGREVAAKVSRADKALREWRGQVEEAYLGGEIEKNIRG